MVSKMKKTKSGAHCHIDVAKVAQGLCRESYGNIVHNNELYAAWRAKHPGASPKGLEEAFVKQYWGEYIPLARATMAHLLHIPGNEHLKESIADALILDKQLVRGREENHQILAAK